MKLQKVLWGALFVVFFLLFFQGMRFFALRSLVFHCNASGAWSLPFPSLLLVLFGIPFLGLAGYLSFSSKKRLESIGWLLLFSGGASNLLERLSYGCIGDYIDISFFPVLNLADILLSSGVFLICISLLGKEFFPRNNIKV